MKKSTIIMLVVAIVAVAGSQFGWGGLPAGDFGGMVRQPVRLVVIAAAILRSYPIPSTS